MRFCLALNCCCFTKFLLWPQPPMEAAPKPPLSVELGHRCMESDGGRRTLGPRWGHRNPPGRLLASCPPTPAAGLPAPGDASGTLLRCWGSDRHRLLPVCPSPVAMFCQRLPTSQRCQSPSAPLQVFAFGVSSHGRGCLERPSERRGRWRPPALTPSAGGCGTSPALPQRC